MEDIFKTAGKYLLLFLTSYLVYIIYVLILRPFLFWYKYKKYSNVYTDPKFRPLLGDIWYNLQNINRGIVHYYHKVTQVKDYTNHDLKVVIEGTNPCLKLVSAKALEEFITMQPHKIDRAKSNVGLSKAAPNGLTNCRTTKSMMERKKLFTNLLNLNYASKYIPGMVDRCDEIFESLQDSQN